jgi:hypothetical protein
LNQHHQLLCQLTTSDELRGRISSVNAMFIIGGSILGQFESELVAGIFSPVLSVVSGGAACILATLVIVALVPGLAKVRVKLPGRSPGSPLPSTKRANACPTFRVGAILAIALATR